MSVLPSMKFFKNCSSVGHLHGLQFFRNGLLHSGSPMSHSSCLKTCSHVGPLHGLQFPSGHVHLLWCGVLLELQCGYPLHCSPLWAAEGQPASPWSSPQAAGRSLLQGLQHVLLLLFVVCRTVPLTFSYLSLTTATQWFFSIS